MEGNQEKRGESNTMQEFTISRKDISNSSTSSMIEKDISDDSTTPVVFNYSENLKRREDKVQAGLLNARIDVGRILSFFIFCYLLIFGVLLILTPMYPFIDLMGNEYAKIKEAYEISFEFFQNTLVYVLLAALAIAGGIGNRVQEIISSIRKRV